MEDKKHEKIENNQKEYEKFINETGIPKTPKDIKIEHSKEYHQKEKELSAYINKLPITRDQLVDLLILVSNSQIMTELDAYMQGWGDGFDKGADWTQKYIDDRCKANAEKYDVLLREKII